MAGRLYCQRIIQNSQQFQKRGKNSAEIMGFGHFLGTIKVGKLADLVLVDGNPDEDIYVMTKPPVHVIKDGEILV